MIRCPLRQRRQRSLGIGSEGGPVRGIALGVFAALFLSSSAPDVATAREPLPWEPAAEESFWYSFSGMESLLLFSGMGVPPRPGELALPGEDLAGLSPVLAPFRAGRPEFAQDPVPGRPETRRWRAGVSDETVALDSLAFAVLTAIGWADRLEQLLHVQSDSVSLRREARLLRALAGASLQFAESKLRRPDGLYENALRWWRDLPLKEGPPPWSPQFAWLAALSAASIAGFPLSPADALFQALQRADPWSETTPPIPEVALRIWALAWYVQATQDEVLRAQAARRLVEDAERLRRLNARSSLEPEPDPAALSPPEPPELRSQAALVSGLLYAYALTDDRRYLREAERAWALLLQAWDEELGLFRFPAPRTDPPGDYLLTVEDVAEVLSAFHAMLSVRAQDADLVPSLEEIRSLYAHFLEGLKRTGLLRSESREAGGAADGDPVPWIGEVDEPPVLVAAARFDPQLGWRIVDRRVRTAPLLRIVATWLWLGEPAGEGFRGLSPSGLPTSPAVQALHLPRRVGALEESVLRMEAVLAELLTRLPDPDRDLASVQDLLALQEVLERRLQTWREEILRRLPPAVDEEALEERVRERVEERIAELLDPPVASLSEGLQDLQRRLEALLETRPEAPTREELERLRAQVQNLQERVGVLEERLLARSVLLPGVGSSEVLVAALALLGIVLFAVGLLRLRRLRRSDADSPSPPAGSGHRSSP